MEIPVNLKMRYKATLTKEDLELIEDELNAKGIIYEDEYREEKEKLISSMEGFEYGDTVIDLLEIKSINELDDNHTVLRFYEGDSAQILCKYQDFLKVYTQLTGKVIVDLYKNI